LNDAANLIDLFIRPNAGAYAGFANEPCVLCTHKIFRAAYRGCSNRAGLNPLLIFSLIINVKIIWLLSQIRREVLLMQLPLASTLHQRTLY